MLILNHYYGNAKSNCVLMVYCVLYNNAFKLFLKGHSVIYKDYFFC